jgi:hypothetical protein
MVIAYVAKLNEISEARRGEQQARCEEQARSAAEATRERLTPLDKRLERLLATIPVEVQLEGFSLSSLQTSLRGRWRGNAHPGEIGRALRRLGFERRRNWRGAQGFCAIWRKTG